MVEKSPGPNFKWEDKDDWKVLKTVLYRNLAFFYSKFKDMAVAIKYLSIAVETQATLPNNLADKIDTETPKLMLAYFLFLNKEHSRA